MDPDDPTVARLATRLAQADVGAVLAGLANGVPTDAARPTQPSIALFEHMAERDDGLAVLLRSHRAVNAELWQVWAAFSDERVRDRRLHRAVLALSTRQIAAYADSVCEHMTADWPQGQRKHRHRLGVPVEQLVRRAVFGSEPVAEAALAELRYPLDACHVAVALPPSIDSDRLDDLARRLKLTCGAQVAAAPDVDGMTVWVAFGRAAAAAGLDRLGALGRPRAAGRPRRGWRRPRRLPPDAPAGRGRAADRDAGRDDLYHLLPRRRAARRPVRGRGAGPGARARRARPARGRRRRRHPAARDRARLPRGRREPGGHRPTGCSSTRRPSSTV